MPKALDRDDGFLTAPEIATLKLDADWVILSACNTAGGSGETAEALSGSRPPPTSWCRPLRTSWFCSSAAAEPERRVAYRKPVQLNFELIFEAVANRWCLYGNSVNPARPTSAEVAPADKKKASWEGKPEK